MAGIRLLKARCCCTQLQHALTGSGGEGWGVLAVQEVIRGSKPPPVCQPGLGLVYWPDAKHTQITPPLLASWCSI